MSALLAFPIYFRRAGAGMYAADTAAMDWFVVATLCCFFFLLGCFATAAWQIWRRTTRPEPHVQLLMELDDEEESLEAKQEPAPEKDTTAAPWEKPPDWWKH